MKIIVYYRVSTKQQEASGLGLEAQAAAFRQFLISHPEAVVLHEYTEIETGKRADRPVLAQAVQHCKAAGATLVIAKLDRLARNVAFVANLMESKVDFICCDNPTATPLTIHILAAIAEDEAKRISRRTKEALAALKARGVKLGAANPKIAAALEGRRGWKKASATGHIVQARLQRERYGQVVPVMVALREQGASYEKIAAHLNGKGYATVRGNPFSRQTVKSVLDRAARLSVERVT